MPVESLSRSFSVIGNSSIAKRQPKIKFEQISSMLQTGSYMEKNDAIHNVLTAAIDGKERPAYQYFLNLIVPYIKTYKGKERNFLLGNILNYVSQKKNITWASAVFNSLSSEIASEKTATILKFHPKSK
jgi:hypothetical protein